MPPSLSVSRDSSFMSQRRVSLGFFSFFFSSSSCRRTRGGRIFPLDPPLSPPFHHVDASAPAAKLVSSTRVCLTAKIYMGRTREIDFQKKTNLGGIDRGRKRAVYSIRGTDFFFFQLRQIPMLMILQSRKNH